MQHPVIKTPRLLLQPFAEGDQDALIALFSDMHVMRLYGGGVTQTPNQTQVTLNYHLNCRQLGYWAWAIAARENGRFLGSLTAAMTDFDGEQWFEPAWIIVQAEWNKGYATEAAQAIVQFARNELGITRFLATTHQDNVASARVAQKVGFAYLCTSEVRNGRVALIYTLRLA